MSADVQLDDVSTPWPWPKTPPVEPPPPPLMYDTVDVEEGNGWKTTYRHFDALLDYVALKPAKVNALHGLSEGWGSSHNWFGCDGGREGALRICQQGYWPEGQARMERELQNLEVPKPRSIKRKGTWADQGDMLDIHRVRSGQLDSAWRRTVRRPRPASQSIVISVPLMIAAMDSSEKLFWMGAAALKLTDLLTEAGYNVSIVGIEAGRWMKHRREAYTTLWVKHPHDPLDMAALTLAVAFPGFARTVGFKSICSFPWDVESDLGELVSEEDKPLLQLGLPPSSVLGGLYDAVRSKESAEEWIASKLALIEQTHLEAI